MVIEEQISQSLHGLGPVARIPQGEGREFEIAGVTIAVFHARDGSVYATQALCPHRMGPLADGMTGGGVVVCPFHGWKFDLRTGNALLGACGVKVYPAHLTQDGEIFVDMAASEA